MKKKKKYEEEYDDEEYQEEKPRHHFHFGILILLVVVAALTFGVFKVFQYYKEVDGSGELGTAVTVTVDQGADAATIAKALKDNGVIETEWLFKFYTKYSGKASNLQYGDFSLQPGMSYNDILAALSVQQVHRKTVTVTFPEGSTSVAIAQLMEQNGLCAADQFLACANGEQYTESDGSSTTADFSQYSFWSQMPEKTGRLFKCEGYLFPNTYEFYQDDTIYNYVNTFYKEFDSEISGLTDALNADIASDGSCITSIDDAVILASFIQEEAGLAAEDAKVSAVFHNRLESSDPLWAQHMLESNACSHITNEGDNNYLWNSPMASYMGWTDAGAIPQEVLDAYDTYAISGLPAGAISNPGYDAINAALNPDQDYISEGYYFFVTGNPTGDYPGQYFYAKTADEHAANCTKAGW